MDSDDETEIAQLEPDNLDLFTNHQIPELRKFVHDERRELRQLVCSERVPLARAVQSVCHFRIRRFVSTVKGFYTGELDLSGRSPARYLSITGRLAAFAKDIKTLSYDHTLLAEYQAHLPEESRIEHDSGSYERLLTFQKKWRIDITKIDIFRLVDTIVEVFSQLGENPRPILQKLYLGDMPSEIIHSILEFSDTKEIMSFGSTGKYQDITPIASFCCLRFRRLKYGIELEGNDRFEASRLLHISRDDLVERIGEIASQPIICHSIQFLFLGGLLQLEDLTRAGIYNENGAAHRTDFFSSVNKALLHLLSKTKNLRRFGSKGWYLSLQIVDAVLSLKSNPVLDIHCCRLPPGENTQKSSHILNASLHIDSYYTIWSWRFVLGCPHLRNLALLTTPHESPVTLFPLLSGVWMNPFKTIERLVVSGFPYGDRAILCQWLEAAKMESPQQSLQLTHVKIQPGESGMFSHDILSLLLALHPSPLRFLSLDGLRYASPHLLITISSFFPNLESLTLQYLASNRQCVTQKARWPRPSWEYATELSRFPKLKHFAWNWDAGDMMETTTSILEFMEDGWPDEEDPDADRERLERYWEKEWDGDFDMDGRDSIARLLAVNCPTLKTVSLVSRSCLQWGYEIRRVTVLGQDGGIATTQVVVEEIGLSSSGKNPSKLGEFLELRERCDPELRWPLVDSSTLPEEEQGDIEADH